MAPESFTQAQGAIKLDELYVVSDLHIGGSSERQIFYAAKEFEALVNELMDRPKNRRVGLLINGDFIDFLAEIDPDAKDSKLTPKEFNPQGALDILNAIFILEDFAPVWSSLKNFLKTKGRTLIINIGNHDLELALPRVRERLCEHLTKDNVEARGRLHLALDGCGVLCRVANATVLCVHGNDVDKWNSVDHGALQRIGRRLLRGQPVESWQPNGGSRMVTKVINPLKRDFPYVDLLKPEGMAVFDFLRAMDAKLSDKTADFAAALGMAGSHWIQMQRGLLEALASGAPEAGVAEDAASQTTETPHGEPLAWVAAEREGKQKLAEDLLERAKDNLAWGLEPMDLLSVGQTELMLDGFVEAITTTMRRFGYAAASSLQGDEQAEVLRNALRVLAGDQTFSLTETDETYWELAKQVSDDIDILVAGHTHLERALTRPGGFYYNSGTWTRLMRIRDDLLKPTEAAAAEFKKIFSNLLQAKTMHEIDDTGLVLKKACVVVIQAEGSTVNAELRHVYCDSQGDSAMRPVENTQFTVSQGKSDA